MGCGSPRSDPPMLFMRSFQAVLVCAALLFAGSLRAADSPAETDSASSASPILAASPTAQRHLDAYLAAKTGGAMSEAFDTLERDGRAAVNVALIRLRAELQKSNPSSDVVNRLDHALVKMGKAALPPV